METEQLHALIEVEQSLGHVVQAEELFVVAIDVIDSDSGARNLLVESLAQARTDVQQRQKSRRVESAAVSQAGANQVVVVRSDCLKNVQQSDWLLNHLVGATDQPGRIRKIS